MFPEEELIFEMMYSMLDVELSSTDMDKRADIIKEIEKIIEKTFYKDEEDATEYYSNKMRRKQELGGKYNEKFLDISTEENNEVEDKS